MTNKETTYKSSDVISGSTLEDQGLGIELKSVQPTQRWKLELGKVRQVWDTIRKPKVWISVISLPLIYVFIATIPVVYSWVSLTNKSSYDGFFWHWRDNYHVPFAWLIPERKEEAPRRYVHYTVQADEQHPALASFQAQVESENYRLRVEEAHRRLNRDWAERAASLQQKRDQVQSEQSGQTKQTSSNRAQQKAKDPEPAPLSAQELKQAQYQHYMIIAMQALRAGDQDGFRQYSRMAENVLRPISGIEGVPWEAAMRGYRERTRLRP